MVREGGGILDGDNPHVFKIHLFNNYTLANIPHQYQVTTIS